MFSKKSIRLFYVAATLLLIAGCSGDDEGPNSQYIVLSKNTSNNRTAISRYDYASKSFTEVLNNFGVEGATNVYAAAVGGDQLFAFCYLPNHSPNQQLVVVDLTSGEITHKRGGWVDFTPSLVSDNNKTVLTYIDYELEAGQENYAAVTMIFDEELNLLDSIFEPGVYSRTGVFARDNKMYVSDRNYPTDGYTLKAIDMSSGNVVESKPVSNRIVKILPLNDGQLICVEYSRLYTIDGESLEEVSSVDNFYSSEFLTVDPAEKIVYFMSPVAQPAIIPYVLATLNLTTKEITYLNQGRYDQVDIPGPPIVFDSKANVIVSSGMRIFSKDGTLLEDVDDFPGTTTHIFVK
jgi:hypothetical protein